MQDFNNWALFIEVIAEYVILAGAKEKTQCLGGKARLQVGGNCFSSV